MELEQIQHLLTRLEGIREKVKEFGIDHALPYKEEIEETFQELQIEGRRLRIGVVGRMKAGKSSLLNGLLFNGKSILPKGVTPTTAVLVVVKYGEPRVGVEFYSTDELEEIVKEGARLEKRVEELEEQFYEELRRKRPLRGDTTRLRRLARRRALEELNKNWREGGLYQHYLEIKGRPFPTQQKLFHPLGEEWEEELPQLLEQYAGTKGEYAPFVKQIQLELPLPGLEGLEVVDTPGVNDPIRSREKRTLEYLEKVDGAIVVSPASQFLTQEDLELIDRLNFAGGVEEILVVASKVDLALLGSEGEGEELRGALERVTEKLRGQLKLLAQEYQGQLPILSRLAAGEVVWHSSLAHQLYLQDGEPQTPDQEHFLEVLRRHFPWDFSGGEVLSSLELLANLGGIEEFLERVRARKSEIIAVRRREFLDRKRVELKRLVETFLEEVQEARRDLSSGQIEGELERFRQCERGLKEGIKIGVEGAYNQLLSQLRREIDKIKLQKGIGGRVEQIIDGARNSEQYTYEDGWWIFKKTKIGTREVLYRGKVWSQLNQLREELEGDVNRKVEEVFEPEKLKKQLLRVVTPILKDLVSDLSCLTRNRNLPFILQKIANAIYDKHPRLELPPVPSELRESGKVYGWEMEQYLNGVHQYFEELLESLNQYRKQTPEISVEEYVEESFQFLEGRLRRLQEQLKDRDRKLQLLREVEEELQQLSEEL